MGIVKILLIAILAGSMLCWGEEPVSPTTSSNASDASQVPVKEKKEREKKVIAPTATTGAGAQGPTVKEIEIVYVGPKSVNRSVILSNMRTTVGQPYSAAAVEEDIRNLYATGFFTNLRISDEPMAEGVKVVVVVQPKPLVKEIVINGNKEIKEKRLKKEIKSKPGSPLSEQQVSEDADKIKDYYRNKAFPNVQVSYKTDLNEEYGRAVVTFNINEGKQAFITKIAFEGNKNISADALRKAMKTKKKNFFSWFNKSGLLKDDQWRESIKAVRDYYLDHGYIDMQIKDVRYEYPVAGQMTIVVSVFEGIQYSVGKVGFRGNDLFVDAELRKHMKMLESSVYSPKGLEDDIKSVRDVYGEKGYIDTEVTPERQTNVESGRIDLIFAVKEGPQSFVDKIIIQGNTRTKDKVLRRELAMAPGDVYDSVSAEASKKRLENLGYFEKVDISPQDTSVPGRKNMVVTVEEKRTGSVTFGVGFSSVDSLLGFVELNQGNFDIANFPYFTGAGQKFRTRLQYGLQRRDFTMGFTEPWFMNQKLSLGFDLFARDAQYLSSLYWERRIGGAVRMAKALNPFWTASLKYQLEEIDLYHMSDSVSEELAREKGARSKSSMTFGLMYDSRDSVMLTRRGEKVDLELQGAGGPLLGQTNTYQISINAQKYFLLPKDIILMLGGSTGVVDKYGSSQFVPLYDRFFIGGSRTVRGFAQRSIGPQDSSGEPMGGRTYAYVNGEVTYPIIDRVRFATFCDAGFDEDTFFQYKYALSDTQVGAGIGLRLNLPIGPIRFDYAWPLIKQSNKSISSSDGQFYFDVGYQF